MDAKTGGWKLDYKQDIDLIVKHLPMKLLLIIKRKIVTQQLRDPGTQNLNQVIKVGFTTNWANQYHVPPDAMYEGTFPSVTFPA